MEDIEEAPQAKRFRHKSYHQQLKDVHLPSTFQRTEYEQDIGDNNSHFHEALDHWRQLSLAPSFIQFASKADPLSASMPLLLHHWREIIEFWSEAMEASDDEGLLALLDLLQKIAHDLRTTLAPVYNDLLGRLLKLLSRSIAPAALTTLLETFNTLFRFLLVPSIHLDLLEQTWISIKSTLPKCLPEIQRAMAEVWGSVLRKLKSAAREKAVTLLASSADPMDDPTAWAFVYACESVSQTLHTATPSIFSPLLAYHLDAEDPEPTYNVIRRSLTALIHHVKNADQFAVLGELLVQQLKLVSHSSNEERTRRMLQVVTVLCAVRQGSRVTDPQKTALFAELEALHIRAALHPALLQFVVSLYTATDMSHWLGPGLKFLQRAWGVIERPTEDGDDELCLEFALQLNGSLAELGWGGWKLVAAPLVVKATARPNLIEKQPTRLLAFLAALKRMKKLSLNEVDLVWKSKIEKCALERLRSLKNEHGDGAATEINDILALSSFFSGNITPLIVEIVEHKLESSSDAEEDPSSALVIGICMHALSSREQKEWGSKVKLSSWARLATQRWGWSQHVLGSLVVLSQEYSSPPDPLSFDDVYPRLRDSILSHSRSLRLSVLRFFDSKLVAVPGGAEEVLKRCLQGEDASLDFQGVRERVLRIGRVGQVVGDNQGADLCARWLVAQLKVNLRPLWSPAAAALSSLSQRFGDLVWPLLFAELKGTSEHHSHARIHDARHSGAELGQESSNDVLDSPWEDERSWRDPSAHKLRVLVAQWVDEGYGRKEFIKSCRTQERFDPASYEYQLLSALGDCSSLVEKHNRELVPYFLSIVNVSAQASSTSASPDTPQVYVSKQKLISWLTLFSKFSNPKALHSTSTLKALYMTYLSHPLRPLQRLALECLCTYKSPHISAHEEQFKAVLDDTRWRDELIAFDIVNLEAQEREEVVDALIRLLFGIMREKRGRSRGADRRAAVLSTLGNCADEELGLLVDLMLQPFGLDRDAHQDGDANSFKIYPLKDGVTEGQMAGYLTLLGDVLRLLGPRLTRHWPALLGTTIDVLNFVQEKIQNDTAETADADENEENAIDGDEEPDLAIETDPVFTQSPSSHMNPKALRSIRQLGLKRFADFFRVPLPFAFEPYLPSSFASFISPRLPKLAIENTQSPSSLLDLFQAWSRNSEHVYFLVRYDEHLLPALYACLVAANVKSVVVDRVFDIIDNILAYGQEDDLVKEQVLRPHVDLLLTNLAKLAEYTKNAPSPSSSSNALSLSLTTPLGQRHLSILSSLAMYSTSASQATMLLNLFLPLFKKPNKQAPEKVKANLLIIIRDMMHLIPDLRTAASPLWRKVFTTLSSLLLSLKTRIARSQLVETFAQFASLNSDADQGWMATISQQLTSLNAYSTKRIDEANFDVRLAAYSSFNDEVYVSPSLSPIAWIPLLHQAMHDIQDGEELSVRTAARCTMERFVDLVKKNASETESIIVSDTSSKSESYTVVFLTTFLPGLRSLVSAPLHFHSPNLAFSFAVKSDLLTILSYTVAQCPHDISPTIASLHPLLEGGDEEANFFNNALHVQTHRRTRAIRRLGERCEKGEFKSDGSVEGSSVVREWLVPIVGWFIGNGGAFAKSPTANRPDQQHHLITNEAVHTLGKLAGCLGWTPYYGLVQRYLRLAKAKDEWERAYVRTIVAILENFNFEVSDGEEVGPQKLGQKDEPETPVQDASEMDVDAEAVAPAEGIEEDDVIDIEEDAALQTKIAPPTRRRPKILSSLKNKLLPALLAYLSPPSHRYEENQNPLTNRLPVAIAVARLTLYLPAVTVEERERKKTEMQRLATELSHMMRSRSQEVRDSVKDVLGKIALLVLGLDQKSTRGSTESPSTGNAFEGDTYLKVIIDELQIALTRGPQIHVLASTVQSIVMKVTVGAEESNRVGTGTVEEAAGEADSNDIEGEAPSQIRSKANPAVLLDIIIPSVTHIASTILFSDISTSDVADRTSTTPLPPNANPTFRETRHSANASYTLFGLAAQFSSPSMLPELLRDVKGVMRTTENFKILGVVDEVLRRVGGGLERNLGLEKQPSEVADGGSDWLLNVVWGLVSGNVAFLKEREEPTKNRNKKKRKDNGDREDSHIVQAKRTVEKDNDHYAQNSFRFIVLGLDLLHTALRRGRFSSASTTTYKQLDALLPVLGNALYSTSTPVLLADLKCVSLLVTRFPIAKLPGMRRALPVYVAQVISIIKSSGGGGGSMGGTAGDLMQGALRTLGIMIRDGPKTSTSPEGIVNVGVEMKEKDLSFLLELVTPDLEDPEKQSVAFTLIRAIVSRRFVVPEMYDIMEDRVAPLLVQSQSTVVREQARALLLQFMLDYPQGKGRLQKTLAFLLRNASSYVHESGRTSILELLGAVLSKFQSGLIKEYGEMLFVTLVMVMANDDSSKCRELAALLVATLYGRLAEDERKSIVRNWLRKWVRAGIDAGGPNDVGKRKLAWVALQVWGVIIDAAAKEQDTTLEDWVDKIVEDVSLSLEKSKAGMDALVEAAEDEDGMDIDHDLEWQLPYYSLTTLGKALLVVPAFARCDLDAKATSSKVPWGLVSAHLLFPHAWVRTAACRALGQLFNAYPINPNGETAAHSIVNSAGLEQDHPFAKGGLRQVAQKLCDQLKSEHLDASLGLQVVKNLVWIGRCWLVEDSEKNVVPDAALIGDPEDEGDDDETCGVDPQQQASNLPWLFSKLSYQVRGAMIRRRRRAGGNDSKWSQQPLAVLRWFAAMTSHIDSKRLEHFLIHILTPVHRIIEEDTIKDEQMDELRSTATELRELVQQKVGGTVFSLTYNTIRQRVLEVRRERKTKRVVMGTLDPERAAKRKEKRGKVKKESRKRKERAFVEARGGGKRRRTED